MTPRILALAVALAALLPSAAADDGAQPAPLLTSDIVITDEEARIDLAADTATAWEIVVSSMNVLGYAVALDDVDRTYGWLTDGDVWVGVGPLPYKDGTWSRVRVRVGAFTSADEQQRAEILLVAVANRFDERVRAASAPAPAAEPAPETGAWDVPVYGRGASSGGGGGGVVYVEDSQPDVYVNLTAPVLSTSLALGSGYVGHLWTPVWGYSWNRYSGWCPWVNYGNYGYYSYGAPYGYVPCSYPILSPSFYYGCGWYDYAWGGVPWCGPSWWHSPYNVFGFGYQFGIGFYGAYGSLAYGSYYPWWYDHDDYYDWHDDHYDYDGYGEFPNNGRGRLARIAREEAAASSLTAGRVDPDRGARTPERSVADGRTRGVSTRDTTPRVSTGSRRSTTSEASRTVMPRIVRTTSRRSPVRVGSTDRVRVSPVERIGELIGDDSSRSSRDSTVRIDPIERVREIIDQRSSGSRDSTVGLDPIESYRDLIDDRTSRDADSSSRSIRLPSSAFGVTTRRSSPSRSSVVTVRSRSGVPYVSSRSSSSTSSRETSPYTSSRSTTSPYTTSSRSTSPYSRSSSSSSRVVVPRSTGSSYSSRSSSSFPSRSSISRPSTSSRSSISSRSSRSSSRSSISSGRSSSRSSISSRSSSRSSSRGRSSSRSSGGSRGGGRRR